MEFLPIFVDIKGRPCLVVGGGAVAARKAALLQRAGARVTVIAPRLNSEMQAHIDNGLIEYEARAFTESDLEDRMLVIAATHDAAANRRVAELARARNVPVNVADNPALGNFIMPSVVDRSPVQIAISTGGASPVLARLLRARLENYVPAAYGRLAALVEGFRLDAKRRFPDGAQRRRFWEQTLQGPVAEAMFAGRIDAARDMLRAALGDATDEPPRYGEVYLVGAGPGDPDLLTFRALRLMQQADVVVYDRLVSAPILDLIRRGAERIYGGKYPRGPAVAQKDINALLIGLAKEGKRVLRLKGGDPFIFGRGGEEIATLIDEGIPFQVVPGITAASGCAAYAGIPLTHRDYAQACIFVTGHLRNGTVDLNWQMLVHPRQTLVFYMGLLGVEIICEQLIKHGLPSTTPAAMIAQGTTPAQRVLIGDLQTLPSLVARSDIKAPTLIIVGQVVRLHDKLRWFIPGGDRSGARRDRRHPGLE
jgi:uroporphyrin-III C-methyltransferase/precorrin-2 dehydrogenase/sirohydrochlorin ferrochelatase